MVRLADPQNIIRHLLVGPGPTQRCIALLQTLHHPQYICALDIRAVQLSSEQHSSQDLRGVPNGTLAKEQF